jgi:hypothetical protein
MNDACEVKKVVLTDDKYSRLAECVQDVKDTSLRIRNGASEKTDALHGATPDCAPSEKSSCGEGWLAVMLYSLNTIQDNLNEAEKSLNQI